MRSGKQLLEAMAQRSYLVDPQGTDADLMEMGEREMALNLRHDHKMGRLAEHHANMTGTRVIVERISPAVTGRVLPADGAPTMAGATMSPSTKESRE